jgi:hypothetical protein
MASQEMSSGLLRLVEGCSLGMDGVVITSFHEVVINNAKGHFNNQTCLIAHTCSCGEQVMLVRTEVYEPQKQEANILWIKHCKCGILHWATLP